MWSACDFAGPGVDACYRTTPRATLDWCHLPGDDDALIMRCCLKASFLLHTALPNETGELYRSMVYPCPNRSVYFSVGSPGWWKLVIVQAGVPSCANFKCEVSHVNKQLRVDFMGVKCVSVECDQPRRWIHFKTYLIRLICRQSI